MVAGIPVNYPATARFEKTPARVVFVNSFNAADLGVRERKENVLQKASAMTLTAAAELFKSLDGLTVVAVEEGIFNENNNADTASLIRQLSKKHTADYVISLDDFSGAFEQDHVEVTRETDGSKTKTAHYNIRSTTTFKLFNADGKSLHVFAGEAIMPHSSRSVVSGLLAAGPALPSNVNDLKAVSKLAVAQAFKTYFPVKATVQRALFFDGPLKTSNVALMKGDYETAKQELRKLIDNADPKLASHAAYNLAVAYESTGEMTAAKDFAAISLKKKDNQLAKDLLERLESSINSITTNW